MQHRPQPFTAPPLAKMILSDISAGDYDMTPESVLVGAFQIA
jgi:hypothetical protein